MTYNLREFDWDSKDKVLTAEESTLTKGGTLEVERLYPFSADVGIKIRNPHSGKVKTFILDESRSNNEMMILVPEEEDCIVKNVYIFND